MFGKKWRLYGISRLLATLMAAIVCLGITGCGNAPMMSRSGNSLQPPSGRLTEVTPPPLIQTLRQELAVHQPQVAILSPKPNEVLQDTQVTVRLQVKDLPTFQEPDLGLGPYLSLLVDNQPYQAVYDPSEPIALDLEPGTHTLRVFASRPWHESFKNEGAYAQTTFHIYTRTPTNTPDPGQPLLTYGRPQDRYGAEPILLDFYLTNVPLHQVANADVTDNILDWKIRGTINGEQFTFDRWQPIYLKGLKPGKNWVQLELLDENEQPVPNAFNNTVRVITYEPGGTDTLSQLVRGELPIEEARRLLDPDYEPPQPEPEPSPEPAPEPLPEPLPDTLPGTLPEVLPETPEEFSPLPDLTAPSPEPSPVPIAPTQEETPFSAVPDQESEADTSEPAPVIPLPLDEPDDLNQVPAPTALDRSLEQPESDSLPERPSVPMSPLSSDRPSTQPKAGSQFRDSARFTEIIPKTAEQQLEELPAASSDRSETTDRSSRPSPAAPQPPSPSLKERSQQLLDQSKQMMTEQSRQWWNRARSAFQRPSAPPASDQPASAPSLETPVPSDSTPPALDPELDRQEPAPTLAPAPLTPPDPLPPVAEPQQPSRAIAPPLESSPPFSEPDPRPVEPEVTLSPNPEPSPAVLAPASPQEKSVSPTLPDENPPAIDAPPALEPTPAPPPPRRYFPRITL